MSVGNPDAKRQLPFGYLSGSKTLLITKWLAGRYFIENNILRISNACYMLFQVSFHHWTRIGMLLFLYLNVFAKLLQKPGCRFLCTANDGSNHNIQTSACRLLEQDI